MKVDYANKPFIRDERRDDLERLNQERHDAGEPHVVWNDDRREWVIRELHEGRWRNQKGVSPSGKPFTRGFTMHHDAEYSLDVDHVAMMDRVARDNHDRQLAHDTEKREQRDKESRLDRRRRDEWTVMLAAADAIGATMAQVNPAAVEVDGPPAHREEILRALAKRPYIRHVCIDARIHPGPALYGSRDGLHWEGEPGFIDDSMRKGEWERRRQIAHQATVVEAWGMDPREDLDDLKRAVREIMGITPGPTVSAWPQDRVDQMARLWLSGFTASEIGSALGLSRNAVIGKAGRIGLPRRTPEECLETLSRAMADGLVAPQDEVLLTTERRADLLAMRPAELDASRKRTITTIAREGQSEFRCDVVDNHGMRCCITGVTVARALQAAHLVPYAQNRDHSKANGVMIRADLHLLLDDHLICIDPTRMTLLVSHILEGTPYWDMRGAVVHLPGAIPPDGLALAWRRSTFEAAEERRRYANRASVSQSGETA